MSRKVTAKTANNLGFPKVPTHPIDINQAKIAEYFQLIKDAEREWTIIFNAISKCLDNCKVVAGNPPRMGFYTQCKAECEVRFSKHRERMNTALDVIKAAYNEIDKLRSRRGGSRTYTRKNKRAN